MRARCRANVAQVFFFWHFLFCFALTQLKPCLCLNVNEWKVTAPQLYRLIFCARLNSAPSQVRTRVQPRNPWRPRNRSGEEDHFSAFYFFFYWTERGWHTKVLTLVCVAAQNIVDGRFCFCWFMLFSRRSSVVLCRWWSLLLPLCRPVQRPALQLVPAGISCATRSSGRLQERWRRPLLPAAGSRLRVGSGMPAARRKVVAWLGRSIVLVACNSHSHDAWCVCVCVRVQLLLVFSLPCNRADVSERRSDFDSVEHSVHVSVFCECYERPLAHLLHIRHGDRRIFRGKKVRKRHLLRLYLHQEEGKVN